MKSEHHRCRKKLVWKDGFIFWQRHAHNLSLSLTHTETGGPNPKKAKAQTGILPLWEKQVWVDANQMCCKDFLSDRGRRHTMKGNDSEANTRDERRGWTEGRWSLNHHEWFYIVMPFCEMRRSFFAVELVSYLAVHEFKVDSLQCDLQ